MVRNRGRSLSRGPLFDVLKHCEHCASVCTWKYAGYAQGSKIREGAFIEQAGVHLTFLSEMVDDLVEELDLV